MAADEAADQNEAAHDGNENHGDDNDGDENSGLQVSEGGGAFSDTETELGGADAVPDKTTGSAPHRASQD